MAEKRKDPDVLISETVEILLLDIEGTVIPVSFVKDTLFPYIKKHVADYLDNHWNEVECQEDVVCLEKQACEDKEMDGAVILPEMASSDIPLEERKSSMVQYVNWLMASDRKVTSLKQLQGHIWRAAYNKGKIKALLYDDVLKVLRHWKKKKMKIYIYSSGSVEAQKLLFQHTQEGDITELLSGHYDTKIGAKIEERSYLKIAEDIGCPPSDIIFLTDITKEAVAASSAGMKTCLVIRPGNASLTDEAKRSHQTIHSFEELIRDEENKSKKV